MSEKTSPEALKSLRDLEGDECFWVHDGPIIKSLNELYKALKIMNDGTFDYHVNREKNDFYNWIKRSVQDEKLANKLKGLKTKKETADVIKERIMELKVKPKVRVRTGKKVIKKSSKKLEKGTKLAKKVKGSLNSDVVEEKPLKQDLAKERDRVKMPFFEHERDSPFTIGGTLIALAALFVVVGILNISKATITGSATAEIKGEATVLLGLIAIITIIVTGIFTVRKIKNRL